MDTVWLQNPLPYLAQYPEADILVSSDSLVSFYHLLACVPSKSIIISALVMMTVTIVAVVATVAASVKSITRCQKSLVLLQLKSQVRFPTARMCACQLLLASLGHPLTLHVLLPSASSMHITNSALPFSTPSTLFACMPSGQTFCCPDRDSCPATVILHVIFLVPLFMPLFFMPLFFMPLLFTPTQRMPHWALDAHLLPRVRTVVCKGCRHAHALPITITRKKKTKNKSSLQLSPAAVASMLVTALGP